MPIIDFRVRPPAKGFLKTIMYADAGRRDAAARRLGMDVSPSAEERSMQKLFEEMDAADVAMGVVPGRVSDFFGSVTNEEILELVTESAGRFIGLASIDPTDRRKAIRQIDEAMSEGLKGVNIEPGAYPVPMHTDDRRLYPIYAHCEDRDYPVVIMAGGNAGPDISYTEPSHLDRVLADFPTLKVVVSHGGWPWVHEILHMAFRRPNLYVSPDMYLHGMPGMDDYLKAADGFLSDRFLYASGYPFVPVKEYAEWFLTLPIRAENMEKVLWRNAANLLGVDVQE